MSAFLNSPHRLKGGIAWPSNPDTLMRRIQMQGAGAKGGDFSEVVRLN